MVVVMLRCSRSLVWVGMSGFLICYRVHEGGKMVSTTRHWSSERWDATDGHGSGFGDEMTL